MKRYFKILILILVMLLIPAVNVSASTGFTYNHQGQPIYSSIGLTVNQPPFIASDLGISNIDFTAPEDLFIYKDNNGVETIYIADSASNKIFVFDTDFVLQETLTRFRVPVANFSDEVLRNIKSQGRFVIARDQFISIPQAMERVYLVNDGVIEEKELLQFEIASSVDFDYEVEWETSNEAVAAVENILDANDEYVKYIVSKGIGTATITGTLIRLKDNTIPDDEDEVMGNVTIQVTVTEEPLADIPVIEKNHSFTIAELRAQGSFNVYLNSVRCVYRAYNPNTGEDFIYLADRSNNQVIVVDALTYDVVLFVTAPDDVTFAQKQFAPTKIVTDGAGRIYVIADNVYEGIIQFSPEGKFHGFTGVNYVTLTPWEIFWRNFSTEEQLAKQASIINTSFTSMTVDRNGFIYATSFALTNAANQVTDDNAMIKRINPLGKDVLRRNGYQSPKGDVIYVRVGTLMPRRGPSKFSGITVNENGVYTVVDAKMGRLFTYDHEGKLLYISGEAMYLGESRGSQINTLSNPVAVRYHGENILVLDKNNKAILVFEPTAIGSLINSAARYEYIGDMTTAATYWEQVVQQNANYEYGYIGIGKRYMEAGDYQTAMEYFKLGADRSLYSRAFKMHRDNIIRQNFGLGMGIILGLIGLRVAYRIINRDKFRKEEESGAGDE